MKIELNINKKYFLAILGIIFIGMGVYAAVDTSQPYHSASQIEFSDGITLEDTRTFQPGDIWVIKIDAVSSRSPTSWKKVGEFMVGQGGTLRTSFKLRSTKSGREVKAKVYVNGGGTGTTRSTTSDNFQGPFVEDIPINPGDKIQLYIYGGHYCTGVYCVTSNVEIQDFKLGASSPLPIIN